MQNRQQVPSPGDRNVLGGYTIIRNRWKVEQKIGQGTFGVIYSGRDINTNDPVAIKVEPRESKRKVLRLEVAVLKNLQTCRWVVPLITCGRQNDFNYMVMKLLSDNIATLRRKQPDGRFSTLTTARLGIQMLRGIEQVHDTGYLHRDIKASNYAMGLRGEERSNAYLIDFGLARRHIMANEVSPPRASSGFRGTARYASINSHDSKDLGRRDDLWSLFYALLEFHDGSLPWSRVRDKNEVGEMKKRLNSPSLLSPSHPPQFLRFMEHLQSLGYADRPNYFYLHDLLLSLYYNSGGIGGNYRLPFILEPDSYYLKNPNSVTLDSKDLKELGVTGVNGNGVSKNGAAGAANVGEGMESLFDWELRGTGRPGGRPRVLPSLKSLAVMKVAIALDTLLTPNSGPNSSNSSTMNARDYLNKIKKCNLNEGYYREILRLLIRMRNGVVSRLVFSVLLNPDTTYSLDISGLYQLFGPEFTLGASAHAGTSVETEPKIGTTIKENNMLIKGTNVSETDVKYLTSQFSNVRRLCLPVIQSLNVFKVFLNTAINVRLDSLQLNFQAGSKISNRLVRGIGDKFIWLNKLEITFNEKLNDTTMESIVKKCVLLEELNLTGCKKVHGVFVNVLLKKPKTKQYVNSSNNTPSTSSTDPDGATSMDHGDSKGKPERSGSLMILSPFPRIGSGGQSSKKPTEKEEKGLSTTTGKRPSNDSGANLGVSSAALSSSGQESHHKGGAIPSSNTSNTANKDKEEKKDKDKDKEEKKDKDDKKEGRELVVTSGSKHKRKTKKDKHSKATAETTPKDEAESSTTNNNSKKKLRRLSVRGGGLNSTVQNPPILLSPDNAFSDHTNNSTTSLISTPQSTDPGTYAGSSYSSSSSNPTTALGTATSNTGFSSVDEIKGYKLCKINLSYCEINKKGLKQLTKIAHLLTDVTLKPLHTTSNYKLTLSEFSSFLQQCTRLASLEISNYHFASDPLLKQISKSCKNIEKLYVDGIEMTDEGIAQVTEHCKKMSKIRTRYGEGVTDRGLGMIADNCGSRLDTLILDFWPSGAGYNSHEGLDATGVGGGGNSRGKEEGGLGGAGAGGGGAGGAGGVGNGMGGVGSTGGGIGVSEGAVQMLLRSCTNLRELSLANCVVLNDGCFPDLGSIGLEGMEGIKRVEGKEGESGGSSNVSKEKGYGGMPYLERLNLSDCIQLNDSCVRKIGGLCPSLRKLEINNVNGLTGGTLIELSNGCPMLEELSIISCSCFTDDEIKKILQRMPRLFVTVSRYVDFDLKECTKEVHLRNVDEVFAKYPNTFREKAFEKTCQQLIGIEAEQ
eukprot:TRINITY_DN811_c0_g1_i1.p1 TRINITY_DN811_c0_g1~~TRINITY_DN811_c0_g1_i1.p1  ORF type:complete len:1306 (-),score=394.34 TRINITY_DN811_c0_g1_i1:182-4099(-)